MIPKRARLEFTTVDGAIFFEVDGGTHDDESTRRVAREWRERIWRGEAGMSRDDGTVVHLRSVRVVADQEPTE